MRFSTSDPDIGTIRPAMDERLAHRGRQLYTSYVCLSAVQCSLMSVVSRVERLHSMVERLYGRAFVTLQGHESTIYPEAYNGDGLMKGIGR